MSEYHKSRIHGATRRCENCGCELTADNTCVEKMIRMLRMDICKDCFDDVKQYMLPKEQVQNVKVTVIN